MMIFFIFFKEHDDFLLKRFIEIDLQKLYFRKSNWHHCNKCLTNERLNEMA